MTVATVYCTREDIADIWSDVGLNLRANDGPDEPGWMEKDGLMARVIRQATDRVNYYCLQRYTAANLATSDYVTDATAVIAAYKFAIRRGNPAAQSLYDRYQDVLRELAEIKAGTNQIPGLAEKFAAYPTLSNLRWDGRYRENKIRVRQNSSTGEPPTGGPTQNTEQYAGGLDFEI